MAEAGASLSHISALGTVTALNTVAVSSRVDGQLMSVSFSEGEHVNAGQQLALIDERSYQAALEQAMGQKQRDEAQLEQARRDLERYKPLAEHHSIPEQQLEQQQALVHQEEGAVMYDEGAVNTAKVNLAYCHISSPIEGRVGLRSVDPGNIVHASSTTGIVSITQVNPISVVFNLPEEQLHQLRSLSAHGAPLTIQAWDRADKQQLATGKLAAIDNAVDTTSGTIRVRALFENKGDALFPNEFVNIHVPGAAQQATILVPTQAVQHQADQAYVFTAGADGLAHRVPVTILGAQGDRTAIGGIAPGQQVVMQGFDRLNDGSQIQVTPAGSR